MDSKDIKIRQLELNLRIQQWGAEMTRAKNRYDNWSRTPEDHREYWEDYQDAAKGLKKAAEELKEFEKKHGLQGLGEWNF
jgi:hypothetical protein